MSHPRPDVPARECDPLAELRNERLFSLFDAPLPDAADLKIDPAAILAMLEAEIDERHHPAASP